MRRIAGRRVLLPVLLSILIIAAYVWSSKADPRPHSRQEAVYVDRTEALFRIIAPEEGTLSFAAYRAKAPLHDTLLVECEDGSGRYLGSCQWNINTGRLWNVCVNDSTPSRDDGPIISAREAVQTAFYWCDALGFTTRPLSAHLVGRPNKIGSAWRVCLRADGRTLSVHVGSRSGVLRMVAAFRMRGPAPA